VSDGDGPDPPKQRLDELGQKVARKAARRARARAGRSRSILFGLGMFGLIGWSVVVPTLAAIALGVWMDAHWPGRVSWTLTLLFVGLAVGCANAWRWVKRESRADRNDG
jgi:ATP synthase protein I